MALKRIKDWATTITSFRSGDVIPVDGPSGTAKMGKDSLLQNVLAGNVAAAFDPNKPNDAGGYAYYADEIVAYQGATYRFKVNHSSGAWNAAEVDPYTFSDIAKRFSVITNNDYALAVVDKDDNEVFKIPLDEIKENTKTFDDTFSARALVDESVSFVKTLGFFSKDDGGEALYEVVQSNELVENGIDILGCSVSGLFLRLVPESSMYIEQIGGHADWTFFDNGTVFNRAFEIGVGTIKLYKKIYCVSTTIVPPYKTTIIGNGASLHIYQDIGFRLENRYFTISNLSIFYKGEKAITNRQVRAFWCENYSGGNHYMWVFEDLYIDKFGVAFRFWGDIKWYIKFKRVRANSCGVAAFITQGFNLCFEEFDINHCLQGVVCQGSFNAVFVCCGLASDGGAAVACISEESNNLDFEDGSTCRQNLKFISCDFETDVDVSDTPAVFFCVFHKYVEVEASFDTCWLTSRCLKAGAYGIALNDYATVTMLNNMWIHGENSAKQYLWNPGHPAKKEIGAVRFIGENAHVARPNVWGGDYIPCVIDNDGVIRCSDIGDMDGYTGVQDGTFVYDTASNKMYCKVNGSYKEALYA